MYKSLITFLVLALIVGGVAVKLLFYSSENGNENNNQPAIIHNQNSNINTKPMEDIPKQPSDSLFPEPNKPPYFYATLGNDWVEINKNWSIRLAEVISDTRCPFGVECEISGKGTVKVQFQQPDVNYYAAYFETLQVEGLNRWPMPNGELKPSLLYPLTIDRTHAITNQQIGFKITLVDLRPYPNIEFVTDVKNIKYIGLFHIEELK